MTYSSFPADESVLLANQPHDLPLGNLNAQIGQQRGQARDRDLPLVVLAQDEALEVRPEMPGDALWRRGHHSLAGRKQPALAPVADRPRHDDDILDDKVLVALEALTLRQAVRLRIRVSLRVSSAWRLGGPCACRL